MICSSLNRLFFMSFWAFPLITSLVAGDVVASESQNGTLKTILTRSRERGQVFAGKVLAALTYTAAVIVAMATIGLIAGGLAWGFNPLTSLSGTTVSTGQRRSLLWGLPLLSRRSQHLAISAARVSWGTSGR